MDEMVSETVNQGPATTGSANLPASSTLPLVSFWYFVSKEIVLFCKNRDDSLK